jgi:hypothetical protein
MRLLLPIFKIIPTTKFSLFTSIFSRLTTTAAYFDQLYLLPKEEEDRQEIEQNMDKDLKKGH